MAVFSPLVPDACFRISAGRLTPGRGGRVTADEVNIVGGKSGLQRAGRWVTPSRGDPKESATENYRRAALISGEALSGKGEKVG